MPRYPESRYRIAGLIFTASVLGGGLTGCEKGMGDLEHYVSEVKARKAAPVQPIPEAKPYRKFEYHDAGLRDPFDGSVISSAVAEIRRPVNRGLSPDQNRTPEYLESFPLDTLRMVGTLEQDDTLWALIKTPDSTIQRVTLGNHMGQHFGKIKGISQSSVELTEIVSDGFGGWRQKEASVAMSEATARR